jgi:DNA-binding transcriptional LysR family regulator
MLNATRLRILREVVRQGSFSLAAHALHLTQPAVSRQIATLEREVGTRLLDRTVQGVRPTEAGSVLVQHADAVVAALAAAEAGLGEVIGIRRGRLRVTAFPTAAVTLLLPSVIAFRHAHPDVEVLVDDAASGEGIRRVRDGEADLALAFRGPYEALDAGGVELVHLLDDPMYVALPPKHRLVRRRRVHLRQLAGDGWVVGSTSELTRHACIAAGFEPRIVARTDQALVSHGLVAAGAGVTLVTGLGLPRARRELAIRPLEEPIVREVSAAVLPGRPRAPAVEELLRRLDTRARRIERHR